MVSEIFKDTSQIPGFLLRRIKLAYVCWALFILAFLLIGAVGHDPWWKRGEAYSFGIVYNFFTSHNWLIPMNAGAPFMEKPPLYYWTACILSKLFEGILPEHDAARLASVFYLCLSAWFTWKCARLLFAPYDQRTVLSATVILLLLGTKGIVKEGHAMITDTALLAGTTIALYGMALLLMRNEDWKRSGFWMGLGAGIAFLSKGLFIPVILGLTGMELWCVLPVLRSRKTTYTLLLAFIVASPFLFIWPALLYHDSPALFGEWFWNNNVGRFLGFSAAKLGSETDRVHFFLQILPIFTFPVLPLACLRLVRAREEWRNNEYLLPAAFLLTNFTVLLISASTRPPYLLPMIPSLSLLAAPALLFLSAIFHNIFNALMRVGFSVAILIIWCIWWKLMHPGTFALLEGIMAIFCKRFPESFIPPHGQSFAIVITLVMTLYWLWTFRLNKSAPFTTPRVWFVGVAVLWCSIAMLLGPWINETRSYRRVLTNLGEFIDQSPYRGQCIGNENLGENIPAMIQYFNHVQTVMPVMNMDGAQCPLLLELLPHEVAIDTDPRWQMIWGNHNLPDIEEMDLRLYARRP